VSVRDRLVEIVMSCARCGLTPRQIAREAAISFGVTCSEADVLLIIGNTTPHVVKADPPAAALDAVVEAHRRLLRAQEGERAALKMVRRKAEADGKDELEIECMIAAAEAAMDPRAIALINAIKTAENAYVLSGGTRDEIDRVLQVHFHTVDSGTVPTPTPGVICE
jgi:hypothetical protein